MSATDHHRLTALDDLAAAPYNPRRISEDAAAGLRGSIETFGDLSGIVWNERTGNLVAGHQRVACVWDKGHFGLCRGYRRQHEFILFYGTLNRTDLSDVWAFPRDANYQHPTQKPVALVIIAAEHAGAKCSGIEIEPKYCDVIIERWERLTGGKAERGHA